MWDAAKARHVKIAKSSEEEKKRQLRKLEDEAFIACWRLEDFKKRSCWASTRLECMKELGYALIHFRYLWPDSDFRDQPAKVEKLCEELGREFRKRNADPVYWNKFLDRIHEEIENLC